MRAGIRSDCRERYGAGYPYCQTERIVTAGAVVHIVPRMAGAKNGIWQVVAGAALIGASFIPGLNAVAAAVLFSAGTSMALGGVAQMLTPVPKTPTVGQTDNGKQNTYFSSLENMVAWGTRCRCCTVK